jgi:predicted nucleotidyltransferase
MRSATAAEDWILQTKPGSLTEVMTRELAMASAREVASYLKRVHGADKVLLFGSVAGGKFQPEHSDIDIYFEGIAAQEECFVAGKTFLDFVDLDLDLIPAGIAPAYLREEILKTGIEL